MLMNHSAVRKAQFLRDRKSLVLALCSLLGLTCSYELAHGAARSQVVTAQLSDRSERQAAGDAPDSNESTVYDHLDLNQPGTGDAAEDVLLPDLRADRIDSESSLEHAGTDQQVPGKPTPSASEPPQGSIESWIERAKNNLSLQSLLTLALFSLAPTAVMLTTSFVRITIVLGLLRQAIGTQQLPSNHVLAAISLFMTILVMSPVWHDVYDQSIKPYADSTVDLPLADAWERGIAPVRQFMSNQIELAGNGEDVQLFYEYSGGIDELKWYDEVPIHVLIPAFILSELKTAFLIGFQIYLPFLVVDLVTASVTMSMGMFMLPPTVLSLPFKILLFVLVDGWRLVVGMLLESFHALG